MSPVIVPSRLSASNSEVGALRTTFPRRSTTIRSVISSTCGSVCEMNTTPRPRSKRRLTSTKMTLVGSAGGPARPARGRDRTRVEVFGSGYLTPVPATRLAASAVRRVVRHRSVGSLLSQQLHSISAGLTYPRSRPPAGWRPGPPAPPRHGHRRSRRHARRYRPSNSRRRRG